MRGVAVNTAPLELLDATRSPSQFSREYSRLYRFSPLRDVESMREPIDGEIVIQR